jgi:signal recognition particle subunit SRP54
MKIQKSFKMLGSMEQILGMLPIPGLTKEMREMISHSGEGQLKRVESIIQSMTKAERQKPESINESRRQRIAKGCGMPETEIAQFLTQFEQMRMIMKQLTRMTDGMKKDAMPGPLGGLKMPRSNRKKSKKDGGLEEMMQGMQGGGGFPGMPGMPGMPSGGFPKLPGGKMPKLPPGFPKGGLPPEFFGK